MIRFGFSRTVILPQPGRLLLYCCCLFTLWSALSAHAQEQATANMLWHQSAFTGPIAYSPTQPRLAVAQGFGDITIMDTSGKVVRTIPSGQGTLSSLAFSPNGMTLASASADATIKLWRVRDGSCLYTLTGHRQGVTSVAFAPDGQTLASSSDDQTIKLWSVGDGACLQTFTGHGSVVTSVAFAPDGQMLASVSYDRSIELWPLHRVIRRSPRVARMAWHSGSWLRLKSARQTRRCR